MPTETKHATPAPSAEAVKKLKELAADRVKRAAQAISSVGNLSEFKPNEAQQKAMIKTLRAACDAAEKQLQNPEAAPGGFELPD